MVRYIKEMYQLDAFTQSNPADQDIINIYKQQQGVRYSFVNINININININSGQRSERSWSLPRTQPPSHPHWPPKVSLLSLLSHLLSFLSSVFVRVFIFITSITYIWSFSNQSHTCDWLLHSFLKDNKVCWKYFFFNFSHPQVLLPLLASWSLISVVKTWMISERHTKFTPCPLNCSNLTTWLHQLALAIKANRCKIGSISAFKQPSVASCSCAQISRVTSQFTCSGINSRDCFWNITFTGIQVTTKQRVCVIIS